ncbi:MAG: DUF4870 domain-containing protein [Terracidiphilus sp.]
MSDPFQTPSPFQPQPSYPQQSPPQQSPPQQAQPYQQAPAYQQIPPTYQQQAPFQQQQPQPAAAQSGLSDNAAGGLAYVTIIPAIIFLIVPPYNRNRFVRFHSWQSIMLAIAWFVVEVGLIVLGRIPGIGLVDLFMGPLVGLAFFVLWIIVLIQAFTGKWFKVPILGDLAEKQANS